MTQQHALSRTELLIGPEALARLRTSTVAVLGIGGVGSYAVEALARCGVGHLVIVDDDTVSLTNLNRQIHATRRTVGRDKVEVMKERIADIDPEIVVDARRVCITPTNAAELLGNGLDYVIDAVDTVTAKLAVAEYCFHNGIRVISSMGTGNKLDPSRFVVTDVYKTSTCPLAKVMRKELRKRNVTALKVVYSEEEPRRLLGSPPGTEEPAAGCEGDTGLQRREKRQIPASISFVPPVAGFILAGEVIRELAEIK